MCLWEKWIICVRYLTLNHTIFGFYEFFFYCVNDDVDSAERSVVLGCLSEVSEDIGMT